MIYQPLRRLYPESVCFTFDKPAARWGLDKNWMWNRFYRGASSLHRKQTACARGIEGGNRKQREERRRNVRDESHYIEMSVDDCVERILWKIRNPLGP